MLALVKHKVQLRLMEKSLCFGVFGHKWEMLTKSHSYYNHLWEGHECVHKIIHTIHPMAVESETK